MTYTPWMRYTVGIEMEMNTRNRAGVAMPGRAINQAITAAIAGVPGARPVQGEGSSYNFSPGTAWDVKYDSSCGFEVASPAISFDANGDSDELRAACDALAAMRPSIDSHCGLHVSVFCRDFTWKDLQRLVSLWTRYEANFFALVPDSRLENHYCRPLREASIFSGNTTHWRSVQTAINATTESSFRMAAQNVGKYASMRFDDWWMKGRVEFRLHSGTVDYVKVRNFALLMCAMVERAKLAGAPTIAVKVPRPSATARKGFTNAYVFEVLGLAAGWQTELHPMANTLLAYANSRRARFYTPRARRAAAAAVAMGLPGSTLAVRAARARQATIAGQA